MIVNRKPIIALQDYIDELWYVDEPGKGLKDIIMPTGQAHVVFNLADPCTLIIDHHEMMIETHTLFGPAKEPLSVRYEGHIRQLGIAFKPIGMLMFFGLDDALLMNSMMKLQEIKKDGFANKLLESIDSMKAGEPEISFKRLESLFLGELKDGEPLASLKLMTHYIEGRHGVVDIRRMAIEFGYSVTTIERTFKKYMGLTPKAYSNIIRFRSAILTEDPVAFFYDQSHFIKACKRYTLKSPKALENAEEITLKHMIKEVE